MNRTIGIRARPDQVADELAIRALAYTFADAVNRRDASTFESLWDETVFGKLVPRSIQLRTARRTSPHT